MAILILIGLLVLLIGGLVVAVLAAKHAQRELEDLEDEFAEHRGVPNESDTPPWSSIDLDVLREDVTDVTGPDPYATLTGVDSAVSWDATDSAPSWDATDSAPTWNAAGAEPNGFEPEPNGFEPEPNGSPTTTDLAPIKDLRPVAWRASADAPVVVLVVGAGFLGTGMTAGLTSADRLQRAWGKVNDSFAETGVITLDPDSAPPAATPDDNGREHEDVTGADTATWPRPRRRRADADAPPEEVPPARSPLAERPRADSFAPPEEELSRIGLRRAERRRADTSAPLDEELPRISATRAERRRAAQRRRAETFAPPEPEEDFPQDSSPRAERGRAEVSAPPEDELSRVSSLRSRRRRGDLLFPRPDEDARKSSPPPRPRRLTPRPSADPEPITWRPPPTRR